MTDRELMQQALEKLEFFTHMKTIVSKDTMRLITALRERLAQPLVSSDGTSTWVDAPQRPVTPREMKPCAGRNCGSTNPNLHSAECFEDYEKSTGLAQPEQEPVAWLQIRENEPPLVAPRNLGTPVYTTPPQRKPLSPQSPCEMTQAEGKMFKLGWLECEAAHGIGEKK